MIKRNGDDTLGYGVDFSFSTSERRRKREEGTSGGIQRLNKFTTNLKRLNQLSRVNQKM